MTTAQTIIDLFTQLGTHIAGQLSPRGGDGFPYDVSAEEFLESWRDYSPFVAVNRDPTDIDGTTKIAQCMVCGYEMDMLPPTPCPNHALDRLVL